MFDVTPDQASAWFDIFNIILFIGAFAVAVGTYGTIKLGEIKERFSNERLSANETATAQANTEAAHANERAAGLENEAAIARERAAHLEKSVAEANARAAEAQLALERFKAPRWIADDQRDRLVIQLKKFQGVAVNVWLIHAPSQDAAPLAQRLVSVLSAIGWNATGVFNPMGGPTATGVVILVGQAATAGEQAAAKALAEELQGIGIAAAVQARKIDDALQVFGAFTGPDVKTPASLWLVVGSKP